MIDQNKNQVEIQALDNGLASTDGGITYSGYVHDSFGSGANYDLTQYRLISPFYFEVYNGTIGLDEGDISGLILDASAVCG